MHLLLNLLNPGNWTLGGGGRRLLVRYIRLPGLIGLTKMYLLNNRPGPLELRHCPCSLLVNWVNEIPSHMGTHPEFSSLQVTAGSVCCLHYLECSAVGKSLAGSNNKEKGSLHTTLPIPGCQSPKTRCLITRIRAQKASPPDLREWVVQSWAPCGSPDISSGELHFPNSRNWVFRVCYREQNKAPVTTADKHWRANVAWLKCLIPVYF